MIADTRLMPLTTNRGGRVLTTAMLTGLVGGAWWYTVKAAGGMCCMLDGLVKAGRAMPFDTAPVAFAAMWTVMLAAMMLPGVIPSGGFLFASGYLAVWIPTCVIAFGALIALNEVAHPSPGLDRVGGALVALAGFYQFTSWKHRLLTTTSARETPVVVGVFSAGLSHGLRCLGSSWALMAVLLVVGVMNVAWMALIGLVCFGEKILTHRSALATSVGVGLVALGVVAVLHPQALQVIAGSG